MTTFSTISQPRTADISADSKFKFAITTFLLQTSHRLGGIAFLATLTTWWLMYTIKDFHLPLVISAATANAGLCCGIAARILTRPGQTTRREANGVAIFNLILFILSIQLMIFARLDVIRSSATDFFTPPPPSPATTVHG